MLSVKQNNQRLDITIASDADQVQQLLAFAHRHFAQWSASDQAKLHIIARELLTNAVRHGNGGDKGRSVRCTIEKREEGLVTICVEDEGDGFDYRSLDYSLPQDARDQATRRGYALIRSLSEGLLFNEKGNQVVAFFREAPLAGENLSQALS